MKTKDSTISVRVDSQLKEDAQRDLEAMGMDLSTYIIMALRAVTSTHELPFKPKVVTPLDRAIASVEAGNVTEAISGEEYLKKIAKYAEDRDRQEI